MHGAQGVSAHKRVRSDAIESKKVNKMMNDSVINGVPPSKV